MFDRVAKMVMANRPLQKSYEPTSRTPPPLFGKFMPRNAGKAYFGGGGVGDCNPKKCNKSHKKL